MSDLIFLKKKEDIEYYLFSPGLFSQYYMYYPEKDHPFYENHFRHKVRMFLEYISGGYKIIYLKKDGEIAGHLVFAKGGKRLKISTKKDIVIGPIFVSERFRGLGLATKGVDFIINSMGLDYNYAYEFIMFNNFSSIRVVEKNNFEKVGEARAVGKSENIVMSPEGNFVVYRYKKPNNN